MSVVSTVQEIQNAIANLPEEQRLSLLEWVHRHEESDYLADDPKLLRLAEEGARQLDAGQGISLEEARKLTSKLTIK
jgi:hypothetical protein